MTGTAVARELWREVPIPARGNTEAPPSVNQEVLWLRHADLAEDPAFTITTAIDVAGTLDPVAMEAAFRALGRRHPALCTVFEQSADGRWQQRFLDGDVLQLEPRAVPSTIEAAALADLMNEFASRPFDLRKGPLVRLLLVARGDRTTVEVAFHHTVTDWVSTQTFFRELMALYGSIAGHRPAELPPLAVGYGDFSVWERELLARGAWDDDLAHWRARLQQPPSALWSSERPATGAVDFTADRVSFTVDPELAAAVHRFARERRMTLFMAVLAAYQLLLHCRSGRDDIVVGIPASARARPETEPLIGYFLNLVPLRADLSGAPTVHDFCHRVRTATIDDMRHATVATGAVYDALQPGACPWRSLWFQARLIFLSSHEGASGEDTSLAPVDVQAGATPYDLTLALWAVGGEMFGRFDFRTAVFGRAEVEALLQELLVLLRVFTTSEDMPVPELRDAVSGRS